MSLDEIVSAVASRGPGSVPGVKTFRAGDWHGVSCPDQMIAGYDKTPETPFDRQPICEIARMVGPGYCLGQAMKKAQESARLPRDRAEAELLGAINYLAAAVIVLRERGHD